MIVFLLTLIFACESGKESQKSSDASSADEVVVTEEKLSTSKNDVKNTVNQTTSTENTTTSNTENTDNDKSSTSNESSN